MPTFSASPKNSSRPSSLKVVLLEFSVARTKLIVFKKRLCFANLVLYIIEKESNMYTKTVTVGQDYGWLPTPIREGYTFAGWNGKNLFNIDNAKTGYYVNSDNGIVSTNPSWVTSDYITIKENVDYTFSCESEGTVFDQFKMVFYDKEKKYITGNSVTGNNLKKITETSPANAAYIIVAYSIKVSGNDVTRYNVQLEEGSTITEYEPYYITNSTTVSQTSNHTLTAIWEQN